MALISNPFRKRRPLDLDTLEGFATHLAAEMHRPDAQRQTGRKYWIGGPKYVGQQLYMMTFKDEFDAVLAMVRGKLGGPALAAFDKLRKDRFVPRDGDLFEHLLAEKLAQRPDGSWIEGRIGSTQVGSRLVGIDKFEVETPWSIRRRKARGLPVHAPDRDDRETMWVTRRVAWPIYAGEDAARAAAAQAEREGRSYDRRFDPLPDGWEFAADLKRIRGGANVSNFSAEAIIAAIDAIADRLDEGSTAATIRGRTGSQPADPDAAETGTLLFTLTCSATAVNAAVDDADGTCSASFAAITDDSAADATGTLGYCRAGATGTGADDHIDGNATTDGSGATDWNTLSIAAGAVISMTSASIGQSQGSTAT